MLLRVKPPGLFSWLFLDSSHLLPFSLSIPLFLLSPTSSTSSSARLSLIRSGINSSTTSLRNSWDVHKKTAVTTIMMTQADGSVQEYTRTFLTMTADLLALDDWLRSHDIKVIAMESTGVFWRPVFNLLEEGRQVILVNAEPHESSTRPQDRRQGQSVACRLA